MAKKIIQIPLEQELRQQLYDALQGDAVLKVMKTLKCAKASNAAVREEINQKGAILLDEKLLRRYPEMYTDVYNAFQEVKETLSFKKDVELYIEFSRDLNAASFASQTKGDPHIVTINSVLLSTMTIDELKAIMGHELGHIIEDTSTLRLIANFIYPNEDNFTGLIHEKYLLWSRLAELIADRYAYLACPDLDIVFSALEKLECGLAIGDLGFRNFDQYLNSIDKELKQISRFEDVFQHTHPEKAIRVKSLLLMALKSEIGDEAYDEEMNYLMSILYKLRDSELDFLIAKFVALAGTKMAEADGEITSEELMQIYGLISDSQMQPKEFYADVMNVEDRESELGKTIRRILKLDAELAPAMLRFLVKLAMADLNINVEEINVLMSLGKKMHLETQEVANLFSEVMAEEFEASKLVLD